VIVTPSPAGRPSRKVLRKAKKPLQAFWAFRLGFGLGLGFERFLLPPPHPLDLDLEGLFFRLGAALFFALRFEERFFFPELPHPPPPPPLDLDFDFEAFLLFFGADFFLGADFEAFRLLGALDFEPQPLLPPPDLEAFLFFGADFFLGADFDAFRFLGALDLEPQPPPPPPLDLDFDFDAFLLLFGADFFLGAYFEAFRLWELWILTRSRCFHHQI